MRHNRMLAIGATLLALLSACSSGGGSKPTIKIGSDGFDEARVVAEVYAQVLEANGYTVDRTSIGMGTHAMSAMPLSREARSTSNRSTSAAVSRTTRQVPRAVIRPPTRPRCRPSSTARAVASPSSITRRAWTRTHSWSDRRHRPSST